MVEDWEALRYFVCIAEAGSLTEASQRTGVSVATLGRRIDRLEAGLGIKLLRRGPAGASLTEAGEKVLEYAAMGAGYLDQVGRVARALQVGAVESHVRISATESMISDVLVPALPELVSSYPSLRIELETSNAQSDLNRGDADIAIRMVKPEDESLVARRLPSINMAFFASKHYLRGRRPTSINISQERLLWYDNAYGPIAENSWLKQRKLENQVVLRATSVRALLRAAQEGLGLAALPCFLAKPANLVRVGTEKVPPRIPWLVLHRDTRRDRTLKAVRDWIYESCSKQFVNYE